VRKRHAVRVERMSLDLIDELAVVLGASRESAVAMKHLLSHGDNRRTGLLDDGKIQASGGLVALRRG
jgi:hypothetical protein